MPQIPQIDVPPPPVVPGTHPYYFIYGEWLNITKPTMIATPENPNPSTEPQIRPVGMNECIDLHPAVFVIMAQAQRPNYQLKYAVGISKEMFEWFVDVQERLRQSRLAMMQGAESNGAGGN